MVQEKISQQVLKGNDHVTKQQSELYPVCKSNECETLKCWSDDE